MDRAAMLCEQLATAHRTFDLVTEDVGERQLHVGPPGTANPLGERIAHVVLVDDAIAHGLLQGKAPLMETSWKGRTGVSDPRFQSEAEWARTVRVDLAKLRPYQRAAFTASEDWVSTLPDAELDRVIDLTEQGFGKVSVAWAIARLLIAHCYELIGEIGVLKGIQGVRGLPY